MVQHCGGQNATFLTLSVKEIENIYSHQESLYIENVIKSFYENWWAVNLGAEKVSRFISFSQLNSPSLFEGYFLFKSKLFRSEFHERSFLMLIFVLRRRILTCLTATDELSSLSATSQFGLLKQNLRLADFIIKLFWFNLPTVEEQYRMFQGELDRQQWMVMI